MRYYRTTRRGRATYTGPRLAIVGWFVFLFLFVVPVVGVVIGWAFDWVPIAFVKVLAGVTAALVLLALAAEAIS